MELYLIRNLSGEPVLVHIMAATGSTDALRPDSLSLPEGSEVRMTRHIVALRRSIGAAGSFPELLVPRKLTPDHYVYELPAGGSLNMSLLLRQLFKHPTSAATLEIHQLQEVVSIQSLAALRKTFSTKSFFSGPLIRYLDLK
ncbi:hypothetical protein GCM10027051_29950 [Niabella terrae]